MQTDKQKFAREFASKHGWMDILKDPKDLSIELLWKIYHNNLFTGKTITPAQFAEAKQAFFVGFTECFFVMTDFTVSLPEDQACEMLSRLNTEAAAYIDSLIEKTV